MQTDKRRDFFTVYVISPLKHTGPQNEEVCVINNISECKCYCSVLVTDTCGVNIAFQVNLWTLVYTNSIFSQVSSITALT